MVGNYSILDIQYSITKMNAILTFLMMVFNLKSAEHLAIINASPWKTYLVLGQNPLKYCTYKNLNFVPDEKKKNLRGKKKTIISKLR